MNRLSLIAVLALMLVLAGCATVPGGGYPAPVKVQDGPNVMYRPPVVAWPNGSYDTPVDVAHDGLDLWQRIERVEYLRQRRQNLKHYRW